MTTGFGYKVLQTTRISTKHTAYKHKHQTSHFPGFPFYPSVEKPTKYVQNWKCLTHHSLGVLELPGIFSVLKSIVFKLGRVKMRFYLVIVC